MFVLRPPGSAFSLLLADQGDWCNSPILKLITLFGFHFYFHFDFFLNRMSCLVQYSDSDDEKSDKDDIDNVVIKRKYSHNSQHCTGSEKKLR